MQTRRQAILGLLIREYIKTAEPVGSQILVENYRLQISPATVRNEMAELEGKGYVEQPHTSAGRVPTDKGYRFYVDNLMGNKKLSKKEEKELKLAAEKNKEKRQFTKGIAKSISRCSNNLGICGFPEMQDFFSSGFSQLFKEVELMRTDNAFEVLESTLSFLDEFDQEMEKLFDAANDDVKIFIGKENIIKELDDFSFVASRCRGRGMVGILGPKRMDYAKNIALVDFAKKLIDESF